MKILYVITGLGLGGAERVVVDLAEKMVQLGHQVKIAYLTGEVRVSPQISDIEIIYLGLEDFYHVFSASKKYQKLVSEYQPDIVHSHMVHANIFVRLNRLFYKIPRLICSAHNSNEGGKIRMLAYKYTNFLSDYNTNVSYEATRVFIKSGAFTEKNINTVYNGIDLGRFKPMLRKNMKSIFNQSEINFLSIGRFNEQKDYPNLIRAIYLAKENTEKPIKFYIAGDGILRPQIEQLIEELNLTTDVILLGARTDIPELINQADFFILSSKYEGFGLVVAEAMACHCFVISTDSSGPSEIMGNTGILVEPQDSNKLAEAILSALDLSEEQIYLNNQQARKRIEDMFSLEKSVRVWLDIYNKTKAV